MPPDTGPGDPRRIHDPAKVVRALRAAGAETQADAFDARHTDHETPRVELDADCGMAFRVFASAGTQWTWLAVAGAGAAVVRRTGLDYARVESVARALGAAWTAELLADLQLMEAAALDAWARDSR